MSVIVEAFNRTKAVDNSPFSHDVIIQFSWNSSHERGCLSTILLMIGGSVAVLAFVSTGWTRACPSFPPVPLRLSSGWVERLLLLRILPAKLTELLFSRPSGVPLVTPLVLCGPIFGRPSMPTEKSHSSSLQSSPTDPKR